jgi:hypothetical protein
MSSYTKLGNYNFSACNNSVRGESRIMLPVMLGLKSVNPYKVQYNDMRVLPPVQTSELNYDKFKNAYPQQKI